MKCHFFLECCTNGNVDLDKRIPFLKTFFPKSELEKKSIGFDDGQICIIMKDVIDLKLISFDEAPCDRNMQVDYYMTELLGYSILDIQFDITDEMAINIDFPKLIFKSQIMFENKEQSFANLIQKVLWPPYQSEEIGKIQVDDKYWDLDLNKTDYESMREDIFEQFGVKYYYRCNDLPGGMSAGPGGFLIEDYENKLTMDDKWRKISISDQGLYQEKANHGKLILKEELLFKDTLSFMSEYMLSNRAFFGFQNMCAGWFISIGKKVDPIRKSINSREINKYYWQELKREIEVIDLNFLEYHTNVSKDIMRISTFPQTLHLTFIREFIEEHREALRHKKQSLFEYLDEVKYAIRNLSTPGHTHDEHLLQEETEITNERILLLSFLAMSIPMLGAIFSPDITMNTKIISAGILFSLPIIYLIFMRIQKTFALKNNIKMERKRQYHAMSASLIKEKQHKEQIKAQELFPEDLREHLITYHDASIENLNKKMKKLEKYK